jgi:hypothetical protein
VITLSEQDPQKSRLGFSFLAIRLNLLLIYIIFSFIPFFSALNVFLPQYFFNNIYIFSVILAFSMSLCLLTVIGILSLRLRFRNISTVVFSLGIIFGFNDPMMLSLGVVLTWLFYELWLILARFHQLDKDYSSYPTGSLEKYRLYTNFKNQVTSILFLAWIALSLSWAVLAITSTFYLELGEKYGTLGLATSAMMLILVFLSRKLLLASSAEQKA